MNISAGFQTGVVWSPPAVGWGPMLGVERQLRWRPIAEAVQSKREIMHAVIKACNSDGSYNVEIKPNGSVLYGIAPNVRHTFNVYDVVMIARKEGSRDTLEIIDYAGYNVAGDYELIDIAV